VRVRVRVRVQTHVKSRLLHELLCVGAQRHPAPWHPCPLVVALMMVLVVAATAVPMTVIMAVLVPMAHRLPPPTVTAQW